MNHNTIIDALGGTSAVARGLGCDASRVSRWRLGGIPPARFPDVAKLAASLGRRDITIDALFAGRLAMLRRAARAVRVTA